MPLFTLTIDKQGPTFGGANPRGERQQLHAVLAQAIEKLGDGVSVVGDILDPNDGLTVIGAWTYTPVAVDTVVVADPVITSMTPAEARCGDPDFILYVSGTGFTTESVLHFAGHDEPTTFANGQLSTGVKPSLWGAPAVVQCAVRNGEVSSNAVDFTFTEPLTRGTSKT